VKDLADDITRAKEGDDEAFCAIVREYQAVMRGYIARFVLDPNDVFDLAQETFVSAYHRIATFEPGKGEFGAWLRGIARTTTLEYLRKTRRRRRREANAVELALMHRREARLESIPDEGADKLEQLEKCVEEVKEKDPERFHLLELRYFQNRSVEAIAEKLKSKEGSIRMALMRLRRALRECVERGLALLRGMGDA